MEINEKVELNKKIKSYDGTNSFLLSLQKQLKTNTVSFLMASIRKCR